MEEVENSPKQAVRKLLRSLWGEGAGAAVTVRSTKHLEGLGRDTRVCVPPRAAQAGAGTGALPAAHRQQRVLGKKAPKGHDGVQADVVWMPPILRQGEARPGRVCPADRSS